MVAKQLWLEWKGKPGLEWDSYFYFEYSIEYSINNPSPANLWSEVIFVE